MIHRQNITGYEHIMQCLSMSILKMKLTNMKICIFIQHKLMGINA